MSQNELVTLLIIVAIVALLVAVGRHDRRRRHTDGSALSGMVGTFDEVFHPEAARATEIREVQRELPAENSPAGEPLELDGTIVISLRHRSDGKRTDRVNEGRPQNHASAEPALLTENSRL